MRIDASQSICMLSRISLFLFMRWLRRPATRHCVRIGGIHAHVDATLPFAFERVGHFQLHLTDILDFDLDHLAVLQRTEAFVVGAAGNEIAGVHCHHRGGELDEFGHAMLHVVGIVVVAELAIVPEAYDQVVRLYDLVGGGDAGADRRERVERLTEPAGERSRRPGAAALLARGDVNHRGIAEYRAAPVLRLHHLGRPLDYHGQLGLVHEYPRHCELGQHNGVAGADHRIRIFHEHVERARFALGMFPIISDAGEDLAWPRQRRAEPYAFERQSGAFVAEFFQRRAQALEIVDDALHRELWCVAFLYRR